MPLIFQKIAHSTEYILYRKKDRRKCCRWACHEFQEGNSHYFNATIDTYIPLRNGLTTKLVYNYKFCIGNLLNTSPLLFCATYHTVV